MEHQHSTSPGDENRSLADLEEQNKETLQEILARMHTSTDRTAAQLAAMAAKFPDLHKMVTGGVRGHARNSAETTDLAEAISGWASSTPEDLPADSTRAQAAGMPTPFDSQGDEGRGSPPAQAR